MKLLQRILRIPPTSEPVEIEAPTPPTSPPAGQSEHMETKVSK